MKAKFPAQVELEADEIYRANRVHIAKFYGITPSEVDMMPQSDVDDTLEVMDADAALSRKS